MRTTMPYLRKWGRPAAIYVDKDSIYKVNRPAAIIANAPLITSFVLGFVVPMPP